MSKGWDNLTLKKLKSLLGKGLSTSEIGRRLGLSKNAVVGKLNRLGWNTKVGTSVKKSARNKDKKTVAKPKKASGLITAKAKTATKAPVKKTVAKKAPVKKKVAKASAPKKIETKKTTNKTATKVAKPENKEPKATKSSSSAKNLAMHQRIIQHSLEMASLKPNQCRWPIGDPDSENFHFCGKTVFTGKPYCYEHCRLA